MLTVKLPRSQHLAPECSFCPGSDGASIRIATFPLKLMNDHRFYDNPLITRYASREMSELWGPQRKHSTWRRLWLVLAEAQAELGLKADDGVAARITPDQLAELRAHLDDIDFARAAEHEHRLRHDVMAHIHTLAEVAPKSRDIVHLGATSCYVTDNTDLLLMREGMHLLAGRLAGLIQSLASFARSWKAEPTLGFTHFQPAQLTTIGKRASLWIHDFLLDLSEIEHRLQTLKFRGAKGTTGTQASFLSLFRGDHDKVRKLDQLVAEKLGFQTVYPVTGQTYSRKVDSQILDALAGIGQSAHKWGTDLRLLAHRQEIDEPFETDQVGSSAMAYKRNPMRAERMCSLARFLCGLPSVASATAATQWFERTLDDSATRRLVIPQAFLTADAVLKLAANLAKGLIVNKEIVQREVRNYLPYLATEPLLMAAVQQGGDRQELHERIRQHSLAVTARIKEGGSNDLLDRLKADPAFRHLNFDAILHPSAFVGRSAEQVDEFLTGSIEAVLSKYSAEPREDADIAV
jgi:adenylosuccinate lyase